MKITTPLVAILVVVAIVLASKTNSQKIPLSPLEENATFEEAKYNGRTVLNWGKPDYASDPAMSHQSGLTCQCTNQCQEWPPVSYAGDPNQLKCDPNRGWCFTEI